MAVDSLFHKVLALIQGGSRANVAPALPVPTPPPLNPVYNAVITFSSNVTDGADHINLSDGVLTITPHAASMRKTVLEVGLHTAIERNLTVEAVFELNLDVVAGAPIANILNTLEIRYAGSGLIDIHYHSTRRDLQYMSSYPYTPAKVTRYVGGGKLYLYARSKVRMDLYTSPPGGYGGSSTSYESQPVEFEIRSESGTVTTIPTAYPFTSDIGSNSFSGASSTNNWNAAPANELSVTTSYVRMGYLPKAANYPTTWRATSRDLVVYGDGGIGMTAVEKTDTGEVIRVLNSTTPVNGMTAYQALTVCAQAIAAQVPETPNILPGKVTTHDQPIYEVQNGMAVVIGYDRTVILSLPHSQVDSVWTLTVACDSTFQSRFQDAGMSSGVFCYGDGLPAIMNVTLSHTGALGVFGVAILDSNYGYWTVPVDQIPDIPPEQIAVYTVSDIDDAFGYIRDRLAQKGTITTAATNATTRVFTLTTSQYLDRYGGPLRHLKFFARKNLIAEGGISKLYGVRFTADERPKESSFPTLPWSTTSIPAGGGGSSDTNTLLLLHLDEGSGATTDDASTYNSTVSATNYASGAVAGKFSGGLNLATSQLTAPHDNRFDIGNTFTIEAFLNFPALPTQSYNILVSHAQSNSWTQGWVVFFDSSGGVGLYNNGSFVFSYGIVGPGQPANLNTWFHFAITADGTTLRIFVDGQVIYTQSTPALESVVQPLCIGHDAGNTYTSALFLIDELRISDVARYTANFTPPTAPFEIGGGTGWGTLPSDVIFAVPAESNGNDVAQFGLTPTVTGSNITYPTSGSRTGDGYIANSNGNGGVDARIKYAISPLWFAEWGAATSMTIEFDVYNNQLDFAGGQFMQLLYGFASQTDTGTPGEWRLNCNLLTTVVEHYLAPLEFDRWYHVAQVADSVNRETRIYLDGVLAQTFAVSFGNFMFEAYPSGVDALSLLQIHDANGNGSLNGRLDNIIITKRAKYSGNFTPGTTFAEIVGLAGIPANVRYYYPFLTGDGSQIPNRGSVVTELQTTSGALSTHPDGGVVFGDGGPINGYDISSQALLSTCTLEGWAKWNIGGSADIFGEPSFGFFLYSGSIYFRMGSYDTPGFTLTTNWVHLATVRAGATSETVSVYINGALHHTFASGTSLPPGQFGGSLRIGSSVNISSADFNGYVDDVIVTEGAKYTANFTPPTRGNAFPYKEPSNVDVTCAGYNDIAFVSCEGSLTIQTSQPVAYFDSSTTVGDVTPTGAVFVVDSVSADFSGSSTLAAFTCSGSFVRSIPVEFDGTATLDDVTNDTGGFYSDVPKEMTGDSVLDDVECIAVLLFLTPMSFDANVLCDDVVSDGLMSLIEPVVYRLNSTVPAATIAANTTQFYVDATVPAATLSAEISQYEGFKLDVTVHAATGQGWFGMRLNSDVPRVALQAVGIVPNTLRLDAMLPWVTIQANASAGLLFSLSATVPIPSLSSWTGWQLQGDVAVASSSGFITTGGAYRLNAVVPMATLVASAVSENLLRLTAVVPAATRSGWVAVNKKVPAARLIGHIVPVVATTRVAYSFTLANSAMTRYPAYPFIQVLRMGNAYYGVGEDGLYELGGANDNGVAIPWSWETCMSDFGKAEKKTVVSAYLGGYVPQSMTYTIKVGDAPTGTNAHTTTATAVLRNHRQKFGIGRKSRFFAFGLSATQGQVAIESVEFEMASMSRRV